MSIEPADKPQSHVAMLGIVRVASRMPKQNCVLDND